MANYLCLGGVTGNLRLGPMEKPDEVAARLDKAWRDHGIAHVDVVLADGIEAQRVSVDPAHYGWWSVLRTPEPDEE